MNHRESVNKIRASNDRSDQSLPIQTAITSLLQQIEQTQQEFKDAVETASNNNDSTLHLTIDVDDKNHVCYCFVYTHAMTIKTNNKQNNPSNTACLQRH